MHQNKATSDLIDFHKHLKADCSQPLFTDDINTDKKPIDIIKNGNIEKTIGYSKRKSSRVDLSDNVVLIDEQNDLCVEGFLH